MQTLLGQDYDFKVLVNSGSNTFYNTDSKELEELKVGDILNSKDELITSDNCYIGLVHKSGQTLELSEQGRYSIDMLHDQIKWQENIAKWHLNSLWDKVFEALLETNNSNNSHALALGLNIQPTGVNSGKLQVIAANPRKLNPVFKEKVTMRWIGGFPPDEKLYVVNVLDIYDRLLLSKNVLGSKFILDFSDKRLINDDGASDREFITVIVASEDNPDLNSWRYGITKISRKVAEQVREEVQILEEAVSPPTLLDKVLIATYFEEKGLLLDALATYEDLIQELPDVYEVKVLYNLFIHRNLQRIRVRG